jgi:hypothetical protein
MNITQRKKLLESFQPIVDSLTDSFSKQQSAISKQSEAINKLILSNKGMAKSADLVIQAHKKTDDATKLTIETQRKLGALLDKETGNSFNKAGSRVNEYGIEITDLGKNMGNFNKRTAIMGKTVASFTKQGKAVSFLEGYAKYVELGGSRLEYFAEYLSSAREELTVFGIEAAKARKVMYGFLPPGMFRLVNKFSSSFQFLGGTLRKMKDNGKSAKEEIERLQAVLASPDIKKGTKDYELLEAKIKELEAEKPPPSILGHLITGFKKINEVAGNALKGVDKLYGGLKNGEPDLKRQYKTVNQYGEELGIVSDKSFKLGLVMGSWYRVQKKIYKGTAKGVFFSTKTLLKDMKSVAMGIPKYLVNPVESLKGDWQKTMAVISKNSLYKTFVEEKGDLKKQFADGFDVSKAMADNQALIDNFDMDAIKKQLKKVNKLSEDELALEAQKEKIRTQIENIPTNTGKDELLVKLHAEMDMLNNIGEKKEELQKRADTYLKLTEKQQVLEAKGMGSVILKEQIDTALDLIKTTEARIANIPDEIKEKDAIIAQIKKERKEIKLNLKAATGKEKGKLQKLLKENQKQMSNEKTAKAGLEAEEAAAPAIIEESKGSIKNNKEQLKLLRQAKKDSFANLLNKHPTIKKISKVFGGVKQILPALGGVLRFAAASMVYVMLAIVGIVVLLKVFGPMIKDAFNKAMEFIAPIIPIITKIVGEIIGNITTIFNSIFGDGGIDELVNGFIDLAFNLLKLSLTLMLAGLGLLASFTWELLKLLWAGAVKYVKDILKDGKKMAKAIIMVVAVVGTIAALILGAPLWIAVVIGVVIWKMGSKLLKPITWATNIIVKIIKLIKAGIDAINPFADGGVTKDGLSLVGEKGPELVKLPKGSRVFSNEESKEISAKNSKSTVIGIEQKKQTVQNHTNNINITINAKDTSKAEMDRIARDISKTIMNNISRQSNSLR